MLPRPVVFAVLLVPACAPSRAFRTSGHGLPPAEDAAASRVVGLQQGTVQVIVEHEDNPAWATYVVDQVAAFLPAAEQHLGIPLHEAAREMSTHSGSPGPYASWGGRG